MKLTSSSFDEGNVIPSLYTCEGKNINPPLEISGIPDETKSLVLIIDDPDVPKNLIPSGIFDHWVVFNLPPSTSKIEENTPSIGVQGKNSYGKNEYVGPCPPDAQHRYFFKLYALNILLDLKEGVTKEDVEKAMEEHIIDHCQLMGIYEKGKGY